MLQLRERTARHTAPVERVEVTVFTAAMLTLSGNEITFTAMDTPYETAFEIMEAAARKIMQPGEKYKNFPELSGHGRWNANNVAKMEAGEVIQEQTYTAN